MRFMKSTGLLLMIAQVVVVIIGVVVVSVCWLSSSSPSYYYYSTVNCYDTNSFSTTSSSLRSSSSRSNGSSSSSSNNARPKRGVHQSRYRKNRFRQVVQENQQERRIEEEEEEEEEHEEEHEEEEEHEHEHDQDQDRILNTNNDMHIYVNSVTGNDSNNNDGSTIQKSVKTLNRALNLVKLVQRPLQANLIVNLSGTFELGERLLLTKKHCGTSSTKRVIFRGDTATIENNKNNKPATKIIGGRNLNFVKVSSLDDDHPAKRLAKLSGVNNIDVLLAAFTSESNGFPTTNKKGRWTDGDCRSDTNNYLSPPTLSIMGNTVLIRAREPNLPPSEYDNEDIENNDNDNSMGEVLDKWMRTKKGNNNGITFYKDIDKQSILLASDKSWNSGSVSMHIFPQVDWFDARVHVGPRANNSFESNTDQNGPGDPEEGGGNFRIVPEARYYLEGAIEYLDTPGEYFLSLGENIEGSRGWTLLYPPSSIDINNDINDINKDLTAVVSLNDESETLFETQVGKNMFVTIEHIHFEGSRRYLANIYGNEIHFNNCNFINSGYDAVEVYGQDITFDNCKFNGSGGSSIRLSDDRDIDTDGPTFGLLLSGNGVVNSILSNFASTCRHYSEGIAIGGFGTIVANNHFKSSNMAAIDLVGGGTKIISNVFSHISDGSYDDGAIHWVAESPMERGTEVSYNIFFRNGVSEEPCNAETSCYQADMYFDDMAGGMAINGNVMIKDKVLQVTPPNKKYAPVTWLGILVNGGADVTVYDNTYYGPEDYNNKPSPIYNGATAMYEQSGGGTYFAKQKICGGADYCAGDKFYKSMRQYGYDTHPWSSAFPELLEYDANPPKKKNGKNWYCANERSCPVAAWNQTFVCNAAIGNNRRNAHKAVWPTDDISQESGDAVAGINVPRRNEALIERGNKPGASFPETVESVDVIEKQGMTAVIEFARRLAVAGEASQSLNNCKEGTRRGASRLDLVGISNNPCARKWLSSGFASCDPCDDDNVECAPRDLPAGNQCSCNDDGEPRPTPSPVTVPSPTLTPHTTVDQQQCTDDPSFLFKKKKNCKWVGKKRRRKRCSKKWKKKKVSEWCPETCDFCPEGCNNCVVKPLYKIYNKKGYCDHKSDRETNKKVNSPEQCWEQCKEEYKFVYAEFTGGTCFCTRKCVCRSDVGNNSIVSILPFDFDLPGQC